MNEDSLERLMDIILQMKINLVHITETLSQQSQEVRQQLEMIFEEERKTMENCLSGIDEKLKECSVYVEDYKRLYESLHTMRVKLVQLGATPSPMPIALPTDDLAGVLTWRLQNMNGLCKVKPEQP